MVGPTFSCPVGLRAAVLASAFHLSGNAGLVEPEPAMLQLPAGTLGWSINGSRAVDHSGGWDIALHHGRISGQLIVIDSRDNVRDRVHTGKEVGSRDAVDPLRRNGSSADGRIRSF